MKATCLIKSAIRSTGAIIGIYIDGTLDDISIKLGLGPKCERYFIKRILHHVDALIECNKYVNNDITAYKLKRSREELVTMLKESE